MICQEMEKEEVITEHDESDEDGDAMMTILKLKIHN